MDEPIRRPASNMVGTVWAPPMSHPPVFFLFTVSETFRGKFKQKESHQIKSNGWTSRSILLGCTHTHTFCAVGVDVSTYLLLRPG